jgi:hypothetical protein
MKLNSIFIVLVVGSGIVACNSKGKNSTDIEKISGAYAREYSFKVINPESGKEIGMRTVRDTIYIRENASDYEVSNNKWSLNDYDKDGWKDMRHTDDRPMPTFNANFDRSNNSLISELNSTLHFDKEKSKLFKDQNESASYLKTKQ